MSVDISHCLLCKCSTEYLRHKHVTLNQNKLINYLAVNTLLCELNLPNAKFNSLTHLKCQISN